MRATRTLGPKLLVAARPGGRDANSTERDMILFKMCVFPGRGHKGTGFGGMQDGAWSRENRGGSCAVLGRGHVDRAEHAYFPEGDKLLRRGQVYTGGRRQGARGREINCAEFPHVFLDSRFNLGNFEFDDLRAHRDREVRAQAKART